MLEIQLAHACHGPCQKLLPDDSEVLAPTRVELAYTGESRANCVLSDRVPVHELHGTVHHGTATSCGGLLPDKKHQWAQTGTAAVVVRLVEFQRESVDLRIIQSVRSGPPYQPYRFETVLVVVVCVASLVGGIWNSVHIST